MTRFLFDTNFEAFKKCGFVDSFIEDPDKMEILSANASEDRNLLFLLFKNTKLATKDVEQIIQMLAVRKVKIVFSYELINDHFMVVVEFPKYFTKDFSLVVAGKYSKLSEEFKKEFPKTKDVYNNKKQRIGKEYTIYYHIFNKTEWLKNYWLKKLNLVELDDNVELWQQPDKKDLVFDIQNII